MRADQKDLIGGGLLTLIGAYMLWRARDYDIGPAHQMGPGYFPMVVALALIFLGLLILGFSFLREGTPIPRPEWRQLLAVLGSVLAFALCIRTLGLFPAVIASSFACAAGHPGWQPKTTAIVAIVMAVACWLLFSKFLGLTMPALTWPVQIR